MAFTALIPLIPSIIRGVESLFGPKKGRQKKDAAVRSLAEIIKAARESGIFPEEGDARELAELVEMVLTTMKSEGTLDEGKSLSGKRVMLTGVLEEVK